MSFFTDGVILHRASLVAQLVKNPSALWETWVQSLGWEYPLEEGIATHSSILAWRIPWTEKPGGLQSMGSQRVRHDLTTEQQQHGQSWNSFKRESEQKSEFASVCDGYFKIIDI